jgi:hypothetical protein
MRYLKLRHDLYVVIKYIKTWYCQLLGCVYRHAHTHIYVYTRTCTREHKLELISNQTKSICIYNYSMQYKHMMMNTYIRAHSALTVTVIF